MDFVVRTLRARPGAFEPNADVFLDEEGRRVVVVAEVAGIDPESLHVFVDERHLSIGGRRREAVRLRRGSFVQKEIGYGEFVKRVQLPAAVEFDDVTASYADGLLVIALPLAAMAYRTTARTELHVLIKRTHS